MQILAFFVRYVLVGQRVNIYYARKFALTFQSDILSKDAGGYWEKRPPESLCKF